MFFRPRLSSFARFCLGNIFQNINFKHIPCILFVWIGICSILSGYLAEEARFKKVLFDDNIISIAGSGMNVHVKSLIKLCCTCFHLRRMNRHLSELFGFARFLLWLSIFHVYCSYESAFVGSVRFCDVFLWLSIPCILFVWIGIWLHVMAFLW